MTDSISTPPPAAPPPGDEPVSDRHRTHVPSEPAEIRRKLLFGVALVLSMVSVYAGLLEWGRTIQYGFAGLAVMTVLIALISGAAGPPRPILVLATTNPGKLREIRSVLAGAPITLVWLRDIPRIEEPEETGLTFEENARLKALHYAAHAGVPGHHIFGRGRDASERTHLVHVVEHLGESWRSNLAFRDALRRDPALRQAYLDEKQRAALAAPDSRARYNEAKQSFIDAAKARLKW